MRDMTAAAQQQNVGGINRRSFLKGAAALPVAAAAGLGLSSVAAGAEIQPIPRSGNGAFLKTSVNAYSFTKLLNAKMKHGGEGMDLYDLVDFCAKYNVDAFDATGYFFPGYPDTPPTDKYINELKLKAYEWGGDQRVGGAQHLHHGGQIGSRCGRGAYQTVGGDHFATGRAGAAGVCRHPGAGQELARPRRCGQENGTTWPSGSPTT